MVRRFVVVASCALGLTACAKFSGEEDGADAQAPPVDAAAESAPDMDGSTTPMPDAGDGGPTPLAPFLCPANKDLFCDEFEREAPSAPSYVVNGNVGFGISMSTSLDLPRTGMRSFRTDVLTGNAAGGFHCLRYTPTTTSGANVFEVRFSLRIPKAPDDRVDLVAVDFAGETAGTEQTIGLRVQLNQIFLWRYGRSGPPLPVKTVTAPFAPGVWHDLVLKVTETRAILLDGKESFALDYGGSFTLKPAALRVDIGVSFAAVQGKPFTAFFDNLVLPQ